MRRRAGPSPTSPGTAWPRRSSRRLKTRTVGLVSLPGTFVGALLGGASPAAAAARFQVIILVAMLTAQSIAAVSLSYLLGAPTQLPPVVAEPSPRPAARGSRGSRGGSRAGRPRWSRRPGASRRGRTP
ncbi:ABC transporter permease [Candidatus Frankia alpina]|uniref:ABC transporter permease n=1 Tax=Candidatus Frankia alpina TaxID=2699483 RepID=UPI0022A79599|nr:ABC transporter permease [Candidatus Frankia alpina]